MPALQTVSNSAVLPQLRTPEELADVVQGFANHAPWVERVRLRTDRRWYERLYHCPDYDVWLISWLPGQSTGFHDHGASAGAFCVTTGILEEHRPGEASRILTTGEARAFGSEYAHDVRNVSQAPAVSIHAYSPPLTEMNQYELEEDRLVLRTEARQEVATGDVQPGLSRAESRFEWKALSGAQTIDDMLAKAREQLYRLTAAEAFAAATESQAVLVDIRPERQRVQEGSIPGALVVERNVLEWRFDPASDSRLPIATSYELQVIVFCSEGYTSSLAAAALQQLGLWRATDMVGGFKAWRAAGLPIE